MEVKWLAALCVTAMAGCGAQTPTGDLTARYQEAGVTVTLLLHDGTLTATYTPDRPGFHLYSADMPATGVDGLGRPTILEPGKGLIAEGTPTADKQPTTLHNPVLGVDLPVYPDGPITLKLDVNVSGNELEATIGYAACSPTQCLMPVSDITVKLSKEPGA